jgi:hypothetical protein
MSAILSPETKNKFADDSTALKTLTDQGGFAYDNSNIPEMVGETESLYIFASTSTSDWVHLTETSYKSKKIYFDIHVPNAETEAAIREARAGINLVDTTDRDDLFRKLNE